MSPRCTDTRRLIGDTEIHDAALWRLADWTPDEIKAVSAPLAGLLAMCPDLNAGHRSVAKMCQRLQRPGDRRDPWTALCALATLWADAHVDLALYHRAGYAVLASYKQALRGNTMPAPDALDELLTSYVRLHPETTAKALFEHCKGLAPVKMVVELAGSESLTYRVAPTSSGLKTVRWHAFEVRVSRIRKGLESAPSIKRTAPASTFHWPSLTQPVVVSCAV